VGEIMHEMALADHILKIVLQKAGEHDLNSIEEISLVSGELMGVVFDTLEFCFQVISEGTIAAEAKLSFKVLEVRIKCRNCQHEFSWHKYGYHCPECKRQDGQMVSGKEFYVEYIQGDHQGR
jgi:hydrogenase nickel incorporation protein HypA/HybF